MTSFPEIRKNISYLVQNPFVLLRQPENTAKGLHGGLLRGFDWVFREYFRHGSEDSVQEYIVFSVAVHPF